MCLTARRLSGRTLLRFTRTPAWPQVFPQLSVHVGHAVRVGPVLVRAGTSTLPGCLHRQTLAHKDGHEWRLPAGAPARARPSCVDEGT